MASNNSASIISTSAHGWVSARAGLTPIAGISRFADVRMIRYTDNDNAVHPMITPDIRHILWHVRDVVHAHI